MQQQSSPTPSSAYLAAKERLAAMSQEELARHKLELARQRAARERAAILAMRERTVRGRIERCVCRRCAGGSTRCLRAALRSL